MKIGVKIGAMSLGALAILLIVGITSYFSVSKMIENNRWVLHTQKVLEEVALLQSRLLDAQNSARGYIVTSDEDYLELFKTAEGHVRESIRELKHLTQDNPVQQQTLDKLEPIADSAIDNMQKTVSVFKEKGYQAALDRIRTGVLKETMEPVRKLIRDMVDVEKKLLLERQQDMTESANNTILTILFGTALAIAFVSLSAYLITRDITGPIRVLVRASDNLARGRFDAAPTFSSRDEFGDLAAAFNQMGHSMLELSETVAQEKKGREHAEQLLQAIRQHLERICSRAGELVPTTRTVIVGFQDNPSPAGTAVAMTGELARAAEELVALARSAGETAKKAGFLSESVARSFLEMQTAVSSLAEKVKSTGAGVATFSDRTEEMNEVVGAVDGIAAELNLLAMGIAMEATRSAEDGKGVSALVDQLKSLAEKARQNGIKAHHILSRIEKAATRAVISSEDAVEAVEPALKNVAQVGDDVEGFGRAVADVQSAVLKVSDHATRHGSAIDAAPHRLERILSTVESERTFIKQCELCLTQIDQDARHAHDLLAIPFQKPDEVPSLI
ncbi:MAG TPA: CHASE3 domain-containing protein [Candidatus Obscuribacterales bacterium]